MWTMCLSRLLLCQMKVKWFTIILLTEGICELPEVSGLHGKGDINIGDGGDNDDEAPGPTAKSASLWDDFEEESNLWGDE